MSGDGSPRVLLWVLVAFGGILVMSGIVFALMWPQLRDALGAPATDPTRCQERLRQLVQASKMYAEDHDGRLMLANSWMDGLQPLVSSGAVFRCPKVGKPQYGYAMVSVLSGRKAAGIREPEKMALFHDSSNLGRNASDGLDNSPRLGRHARDGVAGNNLAYIDGSVIFVPSNLSGTGKRAGK